MRLSRSRLLAPILGLTFVAAWAVVAAGQVRAQAEGPATPAAPLHPSFALLDESGANVLESGGAVSALQTCGQCHDTAFITQHSDHTRLSGWDPLTGGVFSASDGASFDLGTSEEINCFLCHLTRPDKAARLDALAAGDSRWASTATLLTTGIVSQTVDGWQWNPAAFDDDGELKREFVAVGDPTNANCAQCHGVVQTDAGAPLTLSAPALSDRQTALTGQVISGERISDSGMNIAGKGALSRTWDAHAERGLQCTDCHASPNNPGRNAGTADPGPEHLTFDPRRLEIGEYLQRPDHRLGDASVQCESCHAVETVHTWLPYAERHMSQLACETCHVPRMYAPAVQQLDWTVLTLDGGPRVTYRGLSGGTGTLDDLITGFEPALLPREDADGETRLAPYNLIGVWYWDSGDANGSAQPVPPQDLQAAWLENGAYAPEVLDAFDADRDGQLSEVELALDSPEKTALLAARLSALGVDQPRVVGEVRPYPIRHGVAGGEWAIRECDACHGADSRITQPVVLAADLPGGVMPQFLGGSGAGLGGALEVQNGALEYRPETQGQDLYVFGHDRVAWVDWAGALAFVGALLGVSAHGGLRFLASLRAPRAAPRLKRVYMYAVYERFWHWLQTFTIVLLLFTGLIIHRPDLFGVFGFRHVVVAHNVLAALLVINAGLSLFYHLASGEIRQYLPRPYGFFDQAIVQAQYYLRGIFRRDPHPFEKTPQEKLNPLQRATYFGILNVLLPLQIVTGALMWGTQTWPQAAGMLGGLPFLAPFHSLVAWLFAAFIVGHVYLTTTGHEPAAGIRAMMVGWEEMEDHPIPDDSSVVEAHLA